MRSAILKAAKKGDHSAVIVTKKLGVWDIPVKEFTAEVKSLGWKADACQYFTEDPRTEFSVEFDDNYKTFLNQRPFTES